MKTEQLFENKEQVVGKHNQPGVSLDEPTVRKIIEEAIKQEKNNILNEAKTEIAEQIQASQASFITVFGIFASITSFLTIEFQFLKTLNNFLQVLGFTLVLFSLLSAFNLILDYVVKSRINKDTAIPHIWLSGFISLLLLLGIVFTFIGSIQTSSYINFCFNDVL